MPCENYCEHGGVCVLNDGHKGKHDSRYCKWDSDKSLSKEKADKILIAKDPIIGKLTAITETILLNAIKKK